MMAKKSTCISESEVSTDEFNFNNIEYKYIRDIFSSNHYSCSKEEYIEKIDQLIENNKYKCPLTFIKKVPGPNKNPDNVRYCMIDTFQNESNEVCITDNTIRHTLKYLHDNFWRNENPFAIICFEEAIKYNQSYIFLNLNPYYLEKIPLDKPKYANFMIFLDLMDFARNMLNDDEDEFNYYGHDGNNNYDKNNYNIIEDIYNELRQYGFNMGTNLDSEFFTNPVYEYLHKKINYIVNRILNEINDFDYVDNFNLN